MKEKVHVMAEVRKGSKKDLSSISIESGGETLKDYNNYEDNQNIYDFINGNQNSCFPLRGLDDPNDYDEFRHEFLYIDYGYRRGYTQWQLFLSLFTFHNESANVWSHLIGFFCLIIVGMEKWVEHKSTPSLKADSGDMSGGGAFSPWGDFYFQLFMISAAVCLAFSCTYHLLGCYSEAYHRNLLRLDLTGVGLLIGGSFFPSMYYNFHCLPHLQDMYVKLSLLVLVAGLIFPWIEFKIRGMYVRHYLLASLVVVGSIPCIHWGFVTPGPLPLYPPLPPLTSLPPTPSDIYRSRLLPSVFGLFFWYGLGFFFFISRVPERFFPKSVWATMFLPSHTIWHLCVLAAIYVWFSHIILSQQLLARFGCEPYTI